MRAAVFHGERDIRIEDVPDPTCGVDDIVLKVASCGICGTDVSSYQHPSMFASPGQVLGHEFSGRVVAAGSGVQGIAVGDRVTAWPIVPCDRCPRCDESNWQLCENQWGHGVSSGLPGAFAEYVRIPNARLNRTVYRLPEEVSWDAAAMVEPLSVAVSAVSFLEAKPSETVVVMGLGMLGLGAVQALAATGVNRVIGVDLAEPRLQLARSLGASEVVDAGAGDVPERLREITGGGPMGSARVDAVVECTGVEAALAQATEVLRFAGRLALVGLYASPPRVDVNALIIKQVKLRGTFAYRTEYADVLQLLASGRFSADTLVTGRFPLEETTAAFEAQLDREYAVKTMVVSSDVE